MGFFKEIFSRNEIPQETLKPNKSPVESRDLNKSLVEPQNPEKVKISSENQVVFFEHMDEFEKNLKKTVPGTSVPQQAPANGTKTNSSSNISNSKNPASKSSEVVPFVQSPIGAKSPETIKSTSKPIDGKDFDFTGKPKNTDSKLVEPQRPATTYWPKRYIYAPLIILVVENSNAVAKYRNEVINILKKIAKDNKQALFLPVRTGYLEKEFDIMSFEQLDSSKSIDSLVFMSSFEDTGVNLHNSLECVLNKVYDINKNAKTIKFDPQSKDSDATKDTKAPDALTSSAPEQREVPKTSKDASLEEFLIPLEDEERGFFKSKSKFKDKDKDKDKDKFKLKDDRIEYRISEMNAVFIGTGAHTDLDKARKTLNSLIATNSIKSIKYFCVKDTDTINAALLGFPLIGHIESNFYK